MLQVRSCVLINSQVVQFVRSSILMCHRSCCPREKMPFLFLLQIGKFLLTCSFVVSLSACAANKVTLHYLHWEVSSTRFARRAKYVQDWMGCCGLLFPILIIYPKLKRFFLLEIIQTEWRGYVHNRMKERGRKKNKSTEPG